MTGIPLVVLDACVLANFSLCDTLLRLAEPPRLFEPKWSEEIIRETTRTLEAKLGWPYSLTAHLEQELGAHFSEAWISGYESLIPRMTNDEKDRHVAAAIHVDAAIILTLNLRHFMPEHLAMWGIRALHPQSFPNRDLPPGTRRGNDETGATGSRPRPQLASTPGHSERHGARLCCNRFRRNLRVMRADSLQGGG